MAKNNVFWWEVNATPLYDDIPNDDDQQRFYMLAEWPSTAHEEVIEAMLKAAFAQDAYGPHGVRIDSVVNVDSPPAGALYQMVESSKL